VIAPLVRRLVDVRDHEVAAACWSFAYFFCLLCGYFVLRPLRDEMGIVGGVGKLQWLFSGTFVIALAVVPAFSLLVARLPRRRVVPVIYRFFAVNIVAFFVLCELGVFRVAVARTCFIWASVYNLFVVSTFWSVMADSFDRAQARRLFGFIAAGGTAGALVGPLLVETLARPLGPTRLLVLSALLLEACVRCRERLRACAPRAEDTGARPEEPEEAPIGGGALDGLARLFQSRFLGLVALQTVLFSITSTVLYVEQARIVAAQIADSTDRTILFARLDLGVSVATLLLQTTVAGRLITRVGVGVALALVPALSLGGAFVLWLAPGLAVLAALQVGRRAVHYAFERPAREVLFTTVPAQAKYKTKSLIDTVIYRSGDVVGAWLVTGVTAAGLGAFTPLCAAPLGALGILIAGALGRSVDSTKETLS
jgi:AAA family ATP:ADP antiporter